VNITLGGHMVAIKLKISYLRKLNYISQKQLAEKLGVSYQTVSKWENGICMPDISLLPTISEYFNVSVDQLLGLKPINELEYIPSDTDTTEYWGKKIDYLKSTRKSLLNLDYIKFLVEKVWKIDKAIDIIDFGCGYGFYMIDDENTIDRFMNRGLDRFEAESHCKREHKISNFFNENMNNLSIVRLRGILISFGVKK